MSQLQAQTRLQPTISVHNTEVAPTAIPAMDTESTIVEKLTERPVNHCAYGVLTVFTGGIGGIFWVGACLGYCPSCL